MEGRYASVTPYREQFRFVGIAFRSTNHSFYPRCATFCPREGNQSRAAPSHRTPMLSKRSSWETVQITPTAASSGMWDFQPTQVTHGWQPQAHTHLEPSKIGIGYSAASPGPASSTKRLLKNSVNPKEMPPYRRYPTIVAPVPSKNASAPWSVFPRFVARDDVEP